MEKPQLENLEFTFRVICSNKIRFLKLDTKKKNGRVSRIHEY